MFKNSRNSHISIGKIFAKFALCPQSLLLFVWITFNDPLLLVVVVMSPHVQNLEFSWQVPMFVQPPQIWNSVCLIVKTYLLQTDQNSQDVPVQLPGGAVMSFQITAFSVKNTVTCHVYLQHVIFGYVMTIHVFIISIVCCRFGHGLWQKNGHHKPWRAQRILHPCHQKSRLLALAVHVINIACRLLSTSCSRHLCTVSVRGSGATPAREGVPAWLLSQR